MADMSLSPLVHKITIGLALVTIAMTYFGPLLPITEQAQVAVMGFLGTLGAFIKTGQMPPEKAVPKLPLIGLVFLVPLFLVSCGGSSSPPPVYIPPQCETAALQAGGAILLSRDADGGVSREARDQVIDEFAACLKSLP